MSERKVPERQVEDTAQREKSPPQTTSGDVVARQKRAQQKRPLDAITS